MRQILKLGLFILIICAWLTTTQAQQVIINNDISSGIAWQVDSANRSLDWSGSHTSDGTAALRITSRGSYATNGAYQEISEQITWWRSSTTFDSDFWIQTDVATDVRLWLEIYFDDAAINTYDYETLSSIHSTSAGVWTNITDSATVTWSPGRKVAMIRLLIEVGNNSNYYLDDFSLVETPGPLQANLSPTAEGLVTSQTAAQTLILDGRRSYDIDGTITDYLWNLGDNTVDAFTTGSTVTHTFPADGVYTGFLTVVDDRGDRDTTSFTIVCPLPSRPAYSKNPVDGIKNGAAYMENSLSADGSPTGAAGGYGKRDRVNEWLSSEGYETTTAETFMDSDGPTPDRTDLAGDTNDLNGKLLYPDGAPRYLVVVMPGGNDKKFANSMSSRAVIHNLRDFFRNGGSYNGSCAGMSYFEMGYFDIYNMRQGENVGGANGYDYAITGHKFLFRNFLRIWPYYSLNLHEVRSPGIERNLTLGASHPMVSGLTDKSDATGTYYNDGNSLRKDWTHGMDSDTEYFATYRETYTPSGQPDDILEDKWAGIGWVNPEVPGTGRLSLNGWHPEVGNRAYYEYDRASVDYAAAWSETLRPRFKATLQNGQPIAMTGNTQKVGDRQYHYYPFYIPAGITNATVALSGLSDDVDLYVSADDFPTRSTSDSSDEAADTSNRTVSISSPPAGEYIAGVRGESTVPLNGAAYTITLTLAGTPANTPPAFSSASVTLDNATATSAYSSQIIGSATDPDTGDILTYTLLSHDSGPGAGAWLSLDRTGILHGTPSLTDVGIHTWTVQVEDLAGATDTMTITLEVTGSGGTVYTDSITETFEATSGGVIDLDSSSEVIKTADYRWGGYTPGAAVKLHPNSSSQYLRMGGIWNSSNGLYMYTRFSLTGNTPSKTLNASQDASIDVTFINITDHNPDGAPMAFLMRDDANWYISSPIYINASQNGTAVNYPLTGAGALTWTQLASIGDADEVDDGGEGPYSLGTGDTPNLSQLQGWGFAPQGGTPEWDGNYCAIDGFTINVSWTESPSGAAPDAPSNPLISSKATDSLDYSWTDNASDETGFYVYFDAGAASPGASTDSTTADEVTYTASSLTPNTQYAFAVSAYNGNGESSKTTDLVAYTLAVTPTAPILDNPTTHSLDVTPGADSNPTDTQYAIAVTPSGGSAQWVQSNGTLGATPYWQDAATWGTVTVVGLTPDTEYSVGLRAQNGDDIETANGPPATLITTALPAGPPATHVAPYWIQMH